MNAPARPSAQATHLDAIRGLAALLVVIHHVRQLFFVPEEAWRLGPTSHGFVVWISSLGSISVSLFFVLSGFLIAASIRQSYGRGRWSWPRYVDARLTRLVVPLIPALLLTAFWDRLGMFRFGQVGFYGLLHTAAGAAKGDFSLVAFFGNLFFLQGIAVPVFGTNGPLWSLMPEFWYYAIFPLLYAASRPQGSPLVRIGLTALALALCLFIGKEMDIRFFQWLAGAAIAFLPSRSWAGSALFRWAMGAGVVAMYTYEWLWTGLYFRIVAQGAATFFALFVWGLLCQPRKEVSERYDRAATFGSGFSYTLYLVHFPLLAFIAAAAIGDGPRWDVTFGHLALALLLTLLCCVYAVAVWYPFERNSRKIRERLGAPTGG